MPASSRPGIRQVAGLFSPTRHQHRVKTVNQLLGILRDADMRAVVEGHTFRFHLRHAAVDVVLFHFEIGNAVAHEAANLAVLLEEMNIVPGPRQLLRCRQA